MPEWKPANARITLLPVNQFFSQAPSALDLFRSVWGTEPDNFQKQPNALSHSTAQGRRQDLAVICMANLTRIDFHFGPASSSENEELTSTFRLIDHPTQLWDELRSLINAIKATTLPEVGRVAVGSQALSIQDSIFEANQALLEKIPKEFGIKITNEQDFVFQINRSFVNPTAEMDRVNFITKWSVDRLQVVTFMIGSSNPPGDAKSNSFATPQSKTLIGASVAFDVSSVSNNEPMPKTTQSELLEKFADSIVATQTLWNLF